MSSSASSRFLSKRDPWLVAVLSGTATIEVVAAIVVALAASLPVVAAVAVASVLIISAALIVWCLVSTDYRVGEGYVAIRCGPFRSTVPISSIRRVTARRSAIAAPALSCDRLAIQCAAPRRDRVISPAQPDAFVAALVAVNPRIRVEGTAAHA